MAKHLVSHNLHLRGPRKDTLGILFVCLASALALYHRSGDRIWCLVLYVSITIELEDDISRSSVTSFTKTMAIMNFRPLLGLYL